MLPEQSLHLYSPASSMQFTQIPGVAESPKPSLRRNSSNTTGRYTSQSTILVCQRMITSLVKGTGIELTLSFSFLTLTLLHFAANLAARDSIDAGSAGSMGGSSSGGSSGGDSSSGGSIGLL